ncbi:ABC transporter ATP-binding protein [Kitasatospora herbaricolor]|uniref:ABC transporter ATP-binding protein n=1 Tax=Kitasatospora herbaricolor TaxID=68217 RepID=UPI00174C2F9D|nr:ATP-binding cassette domain-containing protein [Kitasatospora herbaricolor]MDQ0310244.1 ABC-type Mn2+/Zn2+ transport system ATPase subunit [Kitasatospora herbaricolor]GGV21177.1 ABC transporter ATP-binding protein [Kitasatospora herbaricolor]
MRLNGVGKRYGRGGRWVLRGADLALEPGALVRIEGPNGSGKSTLLKLAAGIERPSEGQVRSPRRRAYVPERFPPALPFDARGYLALLGRVHGLPAAEARRRADSWLERLGVTAQADIPLSRLSKGTCQKVAVAQALLAEADLLLLDEAWTGLDRASRALLDEAAAERAALGGVVLFVDHDPARLAGLVTDGYRVGRDGALHRLPAPTGAASGPLVEIDADSPDGPLAGLLPARLPGDPDRAPLAGTAVRLTVPAGHSDELLRRLLTGRPAVRVLAVRRLTDPPAEAPPAAERLGAAAVEPAP